MKKEEIRIEGEKAYPIYQVTVNYTEDINDENREYIFKDKILSNNRAKGVISSLVMHETEKDIEFLKQEAKEKYWINFLKTHERGNPNGRMPVDNPKLESIEVKLLRYETWCLTWFSHWTFDDGRSDEEYLESFNSFVYRMQRLPEGEYCLMGAEDRWRWKGMADDSKTKTEAPCRCKFCNAKGIIRIDH
ncbi:MAG: hypothetical protein KAX49_11840 [Halanaerobiales bacterium]|nr:hypothetical protein [Halanaerobiales bacterium]